MLTREDAYYFMILLNLGIRDEFDKCLDFHLENENPLSEIVMNLALCGSDVNKTITCLVSYSKQAQTDYSEVCNRLRMFLKEGHENGKYTTAETVNMMYRFAIVHGDPGGYDFNRHWQDMFYLEEYYSLAEDGIIPWENFNRAFSGFLYDGTSVDYDAMWKREQKRWYHRLLDCFKQKKPDIDKK
jgi:hypothetical protein